MWIVAFLLALQDTTPAPKAPETIVHRMGDLRWQHGANITSIAVLPDDKHALSSGYNGTVVLWDLETGLAIRTFEAHTGLIYSMVLLPDGKRFVTGGADGQVLLWELETAAPVRKFVGHTKAVRSIGMNKDGSRIVSCGSDGWVFVWNPDVEKPVQSMQSVDGFTCSLAVQPGGKLIVVDGPGRITLFDMETGKVVKQLALSGEPDENLKRIRGLERLAFSPDGRYVAVYFRAHGVTVWDVESGQETKPIGSKEVHYNEISFAPDGRVFLTGSKELEIWDFEKRTLIKSLPGSASCRALALKAKGKEIVSTFLDGAIAVWDLDSGKRLNESGSGEIFSVAYSPDGRTVLAGVRGGSIAHWDVVTGRKVRDFDKLISRSTDGPSGIDWAATIALSADGRQALTGHWDSRSALWDVATGKVTREYDHKYGTSIQGVAISPDGRLGAGSGNPAILFEIESGMVRHNFPLKSGAYASVSFSPDSKFLLLGSNASNLRLFETATGKLVHDFEGNPGRSDSLAFTSDGRRAVSGSESGEAFVLWDVATGRDIRSFALPKGPRPSWGSALAVSPDNLYLYTRGPYSELLVWDVESGKLLRTFDGHYSSIKAIALSPGGRFVTTGSHDTTLIHRHPGLPLKERSAAWRASLAKLDDDGEEHGKLWKRYVAAMRSTDYDVWTDTLERAMAWGDRIVEHLKKEFPQPPCRMVKEVGALIQEMDKEELEARDNARKSLSELGEPAYACARGRMNDPKLSAAVRASLKSFCKEIEGKATGPFETKDLGELRAVLILLELPESEARTSGFEHFAEGPLNSVPARLARRYVDHVLRR